MTKKLSKQDFLEKAITVHGDQYEYSKTVYVNMHTPVEILCSTHGSFHQTPNNHIRQRSGCPKCHGNPTYTREEFIKKAVEVHGEEYDYSESSYVNYDTKLKVICEKHGYFWQTPHNHISGNKCPSCVGCGRGSKERFVKNAVAIHGDLYDYSLVEYINNNTPVKIICPKHGVFAQRPANHVHVVHRMGCPICGVEKRVEKSKLDTEEIIKRANKIHNYAYEYSLDSYINAREPIAIKCKKHGVFKQSLYSHLSGSGCPKCSHIVSKPESEISDYLDSLGIQYERNNRTLISPLELDIFIPASNTAIEYCGLYWHSELNGKTKSYHSEKYNLCSNKGIKLLTIFEDEWINHTDVVKSRISHEIGMAPKKIHARKCTIEQIDRQKARNFLSQNHLQGAGRASVYLGLIYGDSLVSIMSFSRPRFSKAHDYEMVRYCNLPHTHIPGGMSKLFSHFVKNYNPKSIVTYADLRYGSGKSYSKAGFVFSHCSPPNYWYMSKYKTRESRIKYQKHKIAPKDSRTEWEVMKEKGFDRIWDCGNNVWVWNKK